MHHDDSLIKYFKIKKTTFVITEKILLISNVKRHKKVYLKLQCLLTRESASSLFL